MGQFSWLDCITEEQIIDNKVRDVYVLIPKKFGGGHIRETCYDGYGHFGRHDIFDLIADWNREFMTKDSKFPSHSKTTLGDEAWAELYLNILNSKKDIENEMRAISPYWEYRYIGITLAGYDEDNASLPYPIKITHDSEAVYEYCSPSKSDPNQGWEYEEEDYEDEDWWEDED